MQIKCANCKTLKPRSEFDFPEVPSCRACMSKHDKYVKKANTKGVLKRHGERLSNWMKIGKGDY